MLRYSIENIDWNLLLFMNGGHTEFWDSFFLSVTKMSTWIPLYILLAVLFIWKLGWKNATYVILGALICFTLTEVVSSKICKPFFERLRPCHTQNGISNLWLPKGCGGLYGFISAHASNTMGIAIYSMSVFIKKIKGPWAITMSFVLLSYAILNGLSRIYLGVHFPSDVLVGFIVGSVVGLGMYKLVNGIFKLPPASG